MWVLTFKSQESGYINLPEQISYSEPEMNSVILVATSVFQRTSFLGSVSNLHLLEVISIE